MLDLGSLSAAAKIAYAKTLAHSIAAGVEPHVAEQIAREALVKAGLVRVAKSAEPTRIAKRLEVKAKPKPELADEIGRDNADAVQFMALYNARRSSNPKARPGEIHSELTAQYPQLAASYRASITGR